MHFVIEALGVSRPGGGRTSILMQLCSVFQQDTENLYTVVVDAPEEAFARFPNVQQRILKVSNRLAAHAVAQLYIPAVARITGAAMVHHTKQLGTILGTYPYIVTIHDMTTLRMPWSQSWIDVAYWNTVQHVVARRATLILTPSEDAKLDVCHYYGVSADRVRTIPWAPSSRFQPRGDESEDATIRRRYGIRDRYLLFVGILALKKNLPTLIRAFQILKSGGGYPGSLVIVGREYPQSSETGLRGLVGQLGLERDIVFTGPVPDDHLPALYRGADIFAFPSLHEGFGIVLLEAMACGVPVVASNTSSIPEVMADAGMLVDGSRDHKAWANTLQQILDDGQLRATMVAKGLQRAGSFSWEKVGRETLDSYLSVVRKFEKD